MFVRLYPRAQQRRAFGRAHLSVRFAVGARCADGGRGVGDGEHYARLVSRT